MSKASRMQNHVIAMIHNRTKENPIYSAEIERRLGVTGVTIREIVHTARTEKNIPICAESKGYFMPSNKAEADRTINSLRSRARQNNEAANGIELFYKTEKQETLL